MAYGTGGCVKKRTKKINKTPEEKNPATKNSIHHEDLALKTAAQYFSEELMPLLGIQGVVNYIAPTETVMLEARQMYQDFNYVRKDGSWIHLEFESDAVTKEDLERAFFDGEKTTVAPSQTTTVYRTSTSELTVEGPHGTFTFPQVAKEKGFIYVDTGAMYRGLAVHFLQNGIDPQDTKEI